MGGRAVLLVLAGFAAGVLAGFGLARSPPGASRAPRPAPTSDAEDAGSAPPAPAPAPGDALSPEVRALLASVRAPDPPAGTGRITGAVRNDRGEPVPDVTIAAEPIDHETRPRPQRDRKPGPRDLEAAVREAAEYELWRRKAERTATTDAEGRYVLEGLLDASYSVRASGHGWLIHTEGMGHAVAPGGTLDFRARPIGWIEVDVRMPDGRPATGATVWCEHGGGKGGSAWSPDYRRVDVPADGRTFTVWAEFGRGAAGLRSDGVPVAVPRGETLPRIELRLRERTSLTVRVEMPEGLRPDGVDVAARLLAEGERPDANLLRQEYRRADTRDAPGTGTWVDAATGRYHVGVFWPRGRDLPVAVQDEVEVGEQPAEAVLKWPAPDPRVTRIVRVLDAEGAPLQHDVTVERTMTGERQRRSMALSALRRDDGSLLVHPRTTEFEGDGEHRLAAEHPLYGRVSERFDPGGSAPVTLRFVTPIHVVVAVRGWGSTGLEGRLAVVAEAEVGSGKSRELDAKGEAKLGPLQPGAYEMRLTLMGENGSGLALGAETRPLSAATPRVDLAVPPLHPLAIRGAAGTRVHVRAGEHLRNSVLVRTVPEDGVLRLDLPEGRYTLRWGGSRVEVEIPGRADATLE